MGLRWHLGGFLRIKVCRLGGVQVAIIRIIIFNTLGFMLGSPHLWKLPYILGPQSIDVRTIWVRSMYCMPKWTPWKLDDRDKGHGKTSRDGSDSYIGRSEKVCKEFRPFRLHTGSIVDIYGSQAYGSILGAHVFFGIFLQSPRKSLASWRPEGHPVLQAHLSKTQWYKIL